MHGYRCRAHAKDAAPLMIRVSSRASCAPSSSPFLSPQVAEYAPWVERYKRGNNTWCDDRTDDDGRTLLHQGDHDLDPATPLRCAGQARGWSQTVSSLLG